MNAIPILMGITAAFGKPSKDIFSAVAGSEDEAKMLEEQHETYKREQESMSFR